MGELSNYHTQRNNYSKNRKITTVEQGQAQTYELLISPKIL